MHRKTKCPISSTLHVFAGGWTNWVIQKELGQQNISNALVRTEPFILNVQQFVATNYMGSKSTICYGYASCNQDGVWRPTSDTCKAYLDGFMAIVGIYSLKGE